MLPVWTWARAGAAARTRATASPRCLNLISNLLPRLTDGFAEGPSAGREADRERDLPLRSPIIGLDARAGGRGVRWMRTSAAVNGRSS
jgi:hypothetical protein